ncbi:MAG: S1 family peptidase [Bifidobacteriaceae bacterium]|jgi:hypothetical protein|nr:S1 family peptidase [Bifidobacteriaceae bacterium]
MKTRKFLALLAALALTGAATVGAQARTPDAVPKAPGPETDNELEEAQAAIQQLLDEGLDQAWKDQDVQSKLDVEALATDFPDVWAEAVIDYEAGTYTIQYDRGADPARVEAFLGRIEAAQRLRPQLSLVPRAVEFSAAEMETFMGAIRSDWDAWTEKLGLPDMVSMGPDYESGLIIIGTSAEINRDVTGVVGYPAKVEGGQGLTELQLSRWADAKPISGGAALITASSSPSEHPPDCTLGFVWEKHTGEIMGGGANHCVTLSGVTSWYNGTTHVGNWYYYDAYSTTDSMLLRSSPQGGFNPNIWLGPANSTQARMWVKGTLASAVGGAVALSAARSGEHATTVRAINQTFTSAVGTIYPGTVTNCTGCLPGDSGAPWFTSLSSGAGVLAHGQHVGKTAAGYCAYVPVAAIGSALSATIATH